VPIEDVKSQIESAREAFRAAIKLVSERWEEAGLEPEQGSEKPWATVRDGEAWSPRQVAEHVLSVDELYASRMRQGIGEPVEEAEWIGNLGRADSFAGLDSAEAALEYLDRRAAEMSQLIDSLDAEALANAAQVGSMQEQMAEHYGFEASATVEGLVAVAAGHWQDHAQQLTTFAKSS
jgi:DinB superfamily